MAEHVRKFFRGFGMNREIVSLYSFFSIQRFALALISLFEPIFLYEILGGNIRLVLAFFLGVFGLYVILVPLSGRVITKLGLKRTMMLSIPFIVTYYLLLNQADNNLWLLVPAVVANTTFLVLFWPAFHIDFARFSEKGRRGRAVSLITVLGLAIRGIGPVIGGLIITFYGFHVVFIVAIAILIVSIFPLLFSREAHEKFTYSYKQSWYRVLKHNRRYFWARFGYGIDGSINTFIWPIFMFMIMLNFSTIGFVTGLSTLAVVVTSFLFGHLSDKIKRQSIVKLSSIFLLFSWLTRIFVRTPLQILGADTFYRVSERAVTIPFQAKFYERAARTKHGFIDEFIVLQEMGITLGRVAILSGLIILFSFTSDITISFIIAAGASLLYWFI